MTQLQISQIWAEINQILQLQCGNFKLKQLCSRDWYLQVLDIIFPDLNDKLESIQSIQSEEAAIDRMLLLMTQQEIIEEDFLQIKGANIVSGHKQSIFYVIQLFMALVEKAIEDAEEEQQQQEEEQGQQEAEQNYDEQFDQQNKNQSQKKQQLRQEIQNYKNLATNKQRQYSDKQNEREYHSVLGIGHQFQPEQNIDQDEEEQIFNYKQNGNQHNEQTFKNVFPQNAKNQPKQLKQTNLYNDNQEDQPEKEYLKHKLQKHKSEEHFKNISKKKSPKESKMHQTQQVRKLVSHPHIPKNYPKANNHQQKKLTKDVKKIIKVSRKKQQNQGSALQRVTSADQLQRKKRELYHYVSNTRKAIKNEDKNAKMQTLKQKNQQKLKRLLKWKQANLRRQKQELEQDMEMKVQLKKQLYLKKINKLILNLEKNRIIEKKREERQRQRKQRQTANKRLQAIEHQYKTQMKLLQQKSEEKLGKKTFVNTDHRQIIQALERQLKKQNEKQIIGLKMKFRRQQAQLEDDLQKLQNQIIKTYKRN